MLGKEKSSKLALGFSPMISTPVVFTSGSEPVSTADGDGALTSTLSVSTVTTNTNVSTSTTDRTTSQVATENPLWMMKKPIAFLGDIITTFTESQKRTSSSAVSGQRHQSRSRYKDHYSYYTRSCSQSPRILKKSSRHHYGYLHGGRSPSPDLSLNDSQLETDDGYGEHSQHRDKNDKDEQQGNGSYENVGNLLNRNQQTAVPMPPAMSANSAGSDLLRQKNQWKPDSKQCWTSHIWPVGWGGKTVLCGGIP